MEATTIARFWDRVQRTDSCWLWTGPKTRGYGVFWISAEKRSMYAHRFAFEAASGQKIPEGDVIDHRCFVPACVNPDHLRSVSYKKNAENRQGANLKSKSGVRGVVWNKRDKRWQGHVKHHGKSYSTRYFTDIAAAEAATIQLRESLFGT